MGLDAAGKGCRIEVFADDDGVRLICNTVDDASCPLNHPGELVLDCFRGEPAAPDSHMLVEPKSIVLECANAYSMLLPVRRDLQECINCTDRTRQCFKSNLISGGETKMPDEEEQNEELNEEIEDENMFEEVPESPKVRKLVQQPTEDIVQLSEDEDDDVDAWFEQVIEEFDTKNEYAFGVVAVKDGEGELLVTMTIDNLNIDIRLEDFIEMAGALKTAIPTLKRIYMEE